jgi:hypothetical protein
MANQIGLHIRKERVDAVALNTVGEDLSVIEYFSSGFESETGLVEALSNCASRFEELNAFWNVGLPTEDYSFRHLAFPFKNRKAISQALSFELENILPYSADEMEVSYLTISSGVDTKLLACAAKKEKLEYYRNALKSAGIMARVIMPDSVALLNFGRDILNRDERVFLADVSGDRILLCYAGDDGFADFHVAPKDVLEMERFLAAFDKEPERRYVAGDGADREFLEGIEDAGIRDVDFLKSLGSPVPPEKMMVPLGLAARGNLSPREGLNFSKDTGFYKKLLSGFDIHAVGAIIFFFLWITYIGYGNHLMDEKLAKTKEQIKKVYNTALPGARAVKPLFQLKQKVKALEAKLKVAGLSGSGRSDLLWLLVEMSKKIPASPETIITGINYDERGVTIGGRTDNFEAVGSIRDALANMESYKSVEVGESSATADKKSVAFKIRMKP